MPSPSGIPLVGGCPPLAVSNGRLDTEHVPCANTEQREPEAVLVPHQASGSLHFYISYRRHN